MPTASERARPQAVFDRDVCDVFDDVVDSTSSPGNIVRTHTCWRLEATTFVECYFAHPSIFVSESVVVNDFTVQSPLLLRSPTRPVL